MAEAESQTCDEQRLAETGVARWNLPDQSASSKRQTNRHRNERLTVLSTASNKQRHSCPRHWCFEKFISRQLGLSMPMLPKLRHLLTKHRQHQRTLLSPSASSISARCTHLHSLPDSNHPAAAIPTELQPVPATRLTLLLSGG